ncbi:membrane protein insertase YidC [Buchnera aphidicola]|uniref:Membrane protein insertase YidC n=1 Tax=Buchnera aphidicola subsp. Melaphis rhois TaxID=118103 RepID=A0A4D6YA74_BUCMH|nr:membrane protein insertase YidC [Buchnera aphidicola]QCI23068.1 membrane protein insertase YidC [Buchnera aphidicola (Melaphis rhois)]
MDLQRIFLIFGMCLISFLFWEIFKLSIYPNVNKSSYQHNNIKLMYNDVKNDVLIETDVLRMKINLKGGDIEYAQLLKFKNKLNSSESLILLDTKDNFLYQTRSGLIINNHFNNWNFKKKPIYTTNKKYFKLNRDQKELRIPLTCTSDNGIAYVKTFILKPDSYDVQVEYKIYNNTQKGIEISMYGGLQQTVLISNTNNVNNTFSLQTFRGAAYSTDNERYEKYSFDSILKKEDLNVTTYNGWIAMLQQYFVTAWIPDHSHLNTFYTKKIDNNVVEIGFYSNDMYIQPRSYIVCNSKLWIGPEIQDKMAVLASNFDLTVDYGWLWFLSQPLFKLLKLLYNIVGNWGISIILITFIMRGAMYPLTKSQYKTMIKMRKLQPKIDKIKENYKDNKHKMSEEILALYKNEKVNPFGGCFPLLIQMPIFLALYYMLIGSVELRHAPFFLWIKDLSSQDPYYVLPVLMGVTMFFIQRITPNSISDPIQKKVMHIVPIIFSIFFLWFPSGLVLYYIISNLVTIAQQKYISDHFKNIEKSV